MTRRLVSLMLVVVLLATTFIFSTAAVQPAVTNDGEGTKYMVQVSPGIARKTELPKGIETSKEKVPETVKDKLDIKFPGNGDGDNGNGISG